MFYRRSLLCMYWLVLGLGFGLLSLSTAADSLQEYSVKAALVLNLARFTEWPVSVLKPEDSVFTVCVLGDNVVQEAFMAMEQKTVGERALHINYLARLRSLQGCHIVYISGLDKNTTIQLLAEIHEQPILSIGEQRTVIDYGGMVNLETQNGKVNIQINLAATKRVGLNISARVLQLATLVNAR